MVTGTQQLGHTSLTLQMDHISILFIKCHKLYFHRATRHSRDVWTKLQRNWIHFYWLTGETPHTLQILVHDIENRFRPHIGPGRHSVLDFRNQVRIAHIQYIYADFYLNKNYIFPHI